MKEKKAKESAKDMVDKAKMIGYIQAACDMTRVQGQEVINLYLIAFQGIIGMELEFWIGDMRMEDAKANRPTQPVNMGQFGDYFFSLYDMRVVVDNFTHWMDRYQSLTAIQNEIFDWHDYSVKQIENGKTYINLFNWLNGCPRDAETSDLAAHERPASEKKGGD